MRFEKRNFKRLIPKRRFQRTSVEFKKSVQGISGVSGLGRRQENFKRRLRRSQESFPIDFKTFREVKGKFLCNFRRFIFQVCVSVGRLQTQVFLHLGDLC